METRDIEIRLLRKNSGQLQGLPQNPRKISKKNLEKLKKSLQDAHEMLRLRELIVVPMDGEYIVIAGNQRLEAAKALGMEKLPCKVLPADTDTAKLREYAIKDNVPFGEDYWEILDEEWDAEELKRWGFELKSEARTSKLSDVVFNGMYYEPQRIDNLKLSDCVDTDLFDRKIKVIEDSELTDEQKKVMRLFAYRFLKIDYEAVADYYAHQASEEERRILSRLRTVLLDAGDVDGFIHAEKQAKNGGRLHHRINYKYLGPVIMKTQNKDEDNIAWDTYEEDFPFTNEPKLRRHAE